MHRSRTKVERIAVAGALLAGGALAALSGCAKTKRVNHYPDLEVPSQVKVVDSSAPTTDTATAVQPTPTPEPVVAGPDAVTGTISEPTPPEGVGPLGSTVPELSLVFFELDKDTLSPEAAETLKKHADFLKSRPDLNVVIRGHTDSSGTDEYNIALGSRRAQAVRDRLVELGIPAARMETISFGENLPARADASEQDKAMNRRAEFFVYSVQK